MLVLALTRVWPALWQLTCFSSSSGRNVRLPVSSPCFFPIETLRMPVSLPDGFGPRPSMSFFLNNQDSNQVDSVNGIITQAFSCRTAVTGSNSR